MTLHALASRLAVLTLRSLLLLALAWFAVAPAGAACSSAGCVSAGPRLASVDSTRGALLNALLGNLAGSTLALSVADWNALATGDVSLLRTASALQATLTASSPSSALGTNATVAQLLTAAASAATAEGKTSLALALNTLQVPLNGLAVPVQLGQLLQSDGVLGTTRINALELVTGIIQLYNARNVATTPQPIVLSGASLGLGALLGNITLQAQVIEPPVIVCGPVGSTFHSAAIRVRLGLDLVSVGLDTSLLSAVTLGAVEARIGHLDLSVEVARTEGVITAVDALAGSLTVQATPGVAALHLGLISDALFFNRARALQPATDLQWGVIGYLKVGLVTVDILAKSSVTAGAALPSLLVFNGPFPQTRTASSGAGAATQLVTSLVANLQLSLGSGLLTSLANTLLGLLKPVVQLALPAILNPLASGLVDPLLGLLGIRLGETDVSAQGTVLACTVSGVVYQDGNHNATRDAGEAGTGVPLYAKLVPASQPAGPALAVAMVDPATGTFAFPSVAAATYSVVISTSSSAQAVAAAGPAGWLPTETPLLTRSITIARADVTDPRFGLFHGGRLSGTVFQDDGQGAGIAHNGLRDGAETVRVDVAVALTDATGTTVHDRTLTSHAGAYTVWVPAAVGTGPLAVRHTLPDAGWVALTARVGTTPGTADGPGGKVTFTNTVGAVYTGVDFGVVRENTFEPDGQQVVLAGTTAFHPHAFTAGTPGTVAFATTGAAQTGFAATVHRDADCNGVMDDASPVLSAPLAVVAGQRVCLVVKVATPADAANGTRYPLALNARFVYALVATPRDHGRTDVTTIGTAALQLVKSVDKAVASSGELITYTVRYSNLGARPLAGLEVFDATPAYTVFSSASCDTVTPGTACSVTVQPGAGAAGRVVWTVVGAVPAGATGTVKLVVQLQ